MTALREGLKRLEQMGLIDVRHGDAMRVNDVRERGTLDVLAPLLMRDGRLDPGVLADVFEARTLMLAELGALAAERRDDAQAERLSALWRAIAAAPGDRAAQELDFAWATELAHAAGNLVFILVLNAIRAAYFANADALPVTADHAALAPLYERAAAAVAGARPRRRPRRDARPRGRPARAGGGAPDVIARARDVFAALVDAVVAPAPPLPPVRAAGRRRTSSACSPRRRDRTRRRSWRRCSRSTRPARRDRRRAVPAAGAEGRRRASLERLRRSPAAPAVQALQALAQIAYYGEDDAARAVGYDAAPCWRGRPSRGRTGARPVIVDAGTIPARR